MLRISLSAAVACFTDGSLFKYRTREGDDFVFYVQLLFLQSDWAETTYEVLTVEPADPIRTMWTLARPLV